MLERLDRSDTGRSGHIIDDSGGRDMNADPFDGDSVESAATQPLDHPRIDARTIATSPGGPQQAAVQGGANADHEGDAAQDTADFADNPPNPGNLRVDYVLPRRGVSSSAPASSGP